MTIGDTVHLALRNLKQAKLRTALTVLGVSIGIASLAGMMSWMRASTPSSIFSVRSMRVPGGARKCSFMRPASVDGKKSVPTTKTRPRLVLPWRGISQNQKPSPQ